MPEPQRLGCCCPQEEVSGPSLLVYEVALCVLAGGLLAGLLVAPWQRAAVADLVVELGEARSGTVRGQLSRALGDPSLEIGYWLPDRAVFVDAEGRVLALPDAGSGRSVTVVEREGQPVAVLVHDPAVLEDPGLLEAVTSAAQLAAANARLRAEVQARVEELAASRRRILAARDEERRRLERRLHEGAEARLGAGGDPAPRPEVGRRRADQRTRSPTPRTSSRGRWRSCAGWPRGCIRGCCPSMGWRTRWRPWPRTSLFRSSSTSQGDQLPQRVAAVAYFVCAEALANVAKHAAAARVAVSVTASDGRVRVEIADDGVGGADPEGGSGLRGLADRVETLGRDAPGGKHSRARDAPGRRDPLGGEATWR